MGTAAAPKSEHTVADRYRAPAGILHADLGAVVQDRGKPKPKDSQLDLLGANEKRDVALYYAGDISLFGKPSVAIVGAREASPEGKSRAYKLARELVASGVVVVSGLAKGIDTAAHMGAIDNGGRTVAVIGTPLDKAYPAENAALQEQIYREHLLVSPFALGERTFRSSFPKRNRVMALLSDATVIVEASDTSGSLHQAAECVRSKRWLFIMKSVMDRSDLSWPRKFLGQPNVLVFSSTQEIVDAIAK